MPVSTYIDTSVNLVVHTGTGAIDLDDVREAVKDRSSHDEFAPGMNVLWDFGNATVGRVPVTAVRDFAEAVTRDPAQTARNVEKVAVVAPIHLSNKMVHALLERTYRIWAEATYSQFRVFRAREEAITWLANDAGP